MDFYDWTIYLMMAALNVFYAPFQFFIGHPERIALMAGFLFVMSVCYSLAQKHSRPTIIAGAGWAAFAAWEVAASDANIRIDLVAIVPVLYVLTAMGLLSPLRKTDDDGDSSDTNIFGGPIN